MVVSCEEVWREISNYLDGQIDPALRVAMEEHFRDCRHCTAVLDGARNIVQLYGDDRMIELPAGFSQRLHRRLEENMPRSRRTFLGWMVAAAAAILVVGSFEVARSAVSSRSELRSKHAQPATGIPPDLMVVVADSGKTFHATSACAFIHDRAHLRTVAAHEAMTEGYAPCVRCMRKYLRASLNSPADAQAQVFDLDGRDPD